MNSSLTLDNMIRFWVLLLVQALVLKGIDVSTYINILIYPLFIILLPVRTPNWLVVLVSFLMGIMVDIFYTTYGVHAMVATFSGFARGLVMRLIEPRGGYTSDRTPNRKMLGDGWFIQYAALFMLLHISIFCIVEIFSFKFTTDLLLRIVLTYVFSLIIVIVSQFVLPVKR